MFSKQKFGIVEDTSGEKVYKIMVKNDPTVGRILEYEQIGIYFWNRIWLTRICDVSEMESIVKVINQMRDDKNSDI